MTTTTTTHDIDGDKYSVSNGKVYNDNGEVAVLFSPGFGAGWSTTNPAHANACLFSPDVVLWVLNGSKSSDCPDFEKLFPAVDGNDFYDGGARDLAVLWVPQGKKFLVKEYDGSESIVYENQINWKVA